MEKLKIRYQEIADSFERNLKNLRNGLVGLAIISLPFTLLGATTLGGGALLTNEGYKSSKRARDADNTIVKKNLEEEKKQ